MMEELQESITHDSFNNTWEMQRFRDEYFIQLAINLTGIAGNILVVISHFMGDMFMVSVNDFVLALACSDLLAAILLLPIPEFTKMPQNFLGRAYCILYLEEALFWMCIKASVFFMMTISLESATAVRKPLLYKKIFCSKCYRRLIILAVLIVAVLSSMFHFFTDKVTDDGTCIGILGNGTAQSATETVIPANQSLAIFISLCLYIVTYLIPLFVMVIAYALTAARLRQNMLKLNHRNSVFARARHRVIAVVFADIIVFFVCLTPSEVIFLLECFNKGLKGDIVNTLNVFRGILHSIYVCANPIIYTATNPQFRLTLKTLCRRPCQKKRKPSHWTPSRPPNTSTYMKNHSGGEEP